MIKVEAIIRAEKVDTIIDKLDKNGHFGLTKTEVEGHGSQKGIVEQFRGKEYRLTFVPKIKLEVVVRDEDVERVVDTITEAAYTGEIGDGKIFIYEIKDSLRVRTRERGEKTL